MKKNTDKGTIIINALEKFPRSSKSSIALYLLKQFPEYFYTVEQARSSIRYYTGANGADSLKGRGEENIIKRTYQKPESYSINVRSEPFIIPLNIKNLGIISDLHVPYHDNDAIEVALEKFSEKKIDALLINGDLCDFYGISFFARDPRVRDFQTEILQIIQMLEYLRFRFPDIPIYFKEGNHEERYERYMIKHAPALLDNPDFQIENILMLNHFRIQYIKDRRRIIFGRLNILHGHELSGRFGSGVTPARTFYMKAKDNIVCGHVHRVQSYTDKRIDGTINGGWTMGCLSELSPDYHPINEYQHGCMRVERIEGKTKQNFRVFNYQIIDGQII